MAIQALGKITVPVPGTPVLVTGNLAATGTPPLAPMTRCHGIMVEALPTNTGKVYVGTVAMVAATGVQVFAILAIPTVNFLPTFSAANTFSPVSGKRRWASGGKVAGAPRGH